MSRHLCRLFIALLVGIWTPMLVLAGAPASRSWKWSPELMRPFWLGDTVHGESVLFVKDNASGGPRADVFFPITKILSVCNSAGDVTYEEGRDYRWKPGSRTIELPAGSRIVSVTPDQLRRPKNSQKYHLTRRDGKGEILFGGGLEYHHMQTVITYQHRPEPWKAATAHDDPKALPRTISRLKNGQDIALVVLGDSISTGCNASLWGNGAPFQPPYFGLLQQHLEACYGVKVKLTNLSVGGTVSRWGTTMTDKVIAARPDLVILAFGMNDAGGVPAREYQTNIKTIISRVRKQCPQCEFILIATMLGNPEWVHLKQNLFYEYRDALKKLCGPGVALADLTSVWNELLKRKQYRDLTGNGVNHPNDFGHRIYAQVLAALL